MSQNEELRDEMMSQKNPNIWEYNGNTFELDVGDAEDAEHLENAFKRLEAAEKTVKRDGSLAEIVCAYDSMFRNLYDDIFGEGAGDMVLGERRNIDNCNASYESLLAFIEGQNAHFIQRTESLTARYGSNRAQRRAYRRG